MGRVVDRWFGPVILLALAIALFLGLSAGASEEDAVHGAGSTFAAPLYARWTALFEREAGITVLYDAVGSGAGIEAILEREVAFGGSDALMTLEEKQEAEGMIRSLPMALGPVVVAYNLPEVDERIVLNGDVIADIYLGHIERWDDAKIQELNADVRLPDREIHVTHRSDSSGTSAIFTDYLSAVSTEWADEYGMSKEPDWPVSDGVGEGNDGVAQQVLVRPGGIGYVESTYAELSGVDVAAIMNKAGNIVMPSIESVQAAERSTPALPGSNEKPSIVDASADDAYPVTGYTYIMVHRDLTYLEPSQASGLVEYLDWGLTEGQAEAVELGYTPLPEELAAETRADLDTLVGG